MGIIKVKYAYVVVVSPLEKVIAISSLLLVCDVAGRIQGV
jgi:hypothetical protein